MERKLVSINETLRALSLPRSTVNALIQAGTLDSVKIGRRRLVKVSSIARLAGDPETLAA